MAPPKRHIKQPVIIEEIIGEVVAATSAARVAAGGSAVHYEHGPWAEIEATLQSMTNSAGLFMPDGVTPVPKKYPLICLIQDFPEDIGGTDYYGIATLPIILIATITDNKFKSAKRLTETFKPILLPIYEEFLYQLTASRHINAGSVKQLPHRKWNRMFWGKQKAGTALNDFVDAIEINNLKLTLFQKC